MSYLVRGEVRSIDNDRAIVRLDKAPECSHPLPMGNRCDACRKVEVVIAPGTFYFVKDGVDRPMVVKPPRWYEFQFPYVGTGVLMNISVAERGFVVNQWVLEHFFQASQAKAEARRAYDAYIEGELSEILIERIGYLPADHPLRAIYSFATADELLDDGWVYQRSCQGKNYKPEETPSPQIGVVAISYDKKGRELPSGKVAIWTRQQWFVPMLDNKSRPQLAVLKHLGLVKIGQCSDKVAVVLVPEGWTKREDKNNNFLIHDQNGVVRLCYSLKKGSSGYDGRIHFWVWDVPSDGASASAAA